MHVVFVIFIVGFLDYLFICDIGYTCPLMQLAVVMVPISFQHQMMCHSTGT